MEIWFYHLESQPLDRALPALVEKALEKDWGVVIETVDDLRVKALDDLLWTYRADAFLPHAVSSDRGASAQPILVTREPDNPNDAVLRIFVEGAEIPSDIPPGYARFILLFDGGNEVELDAARGQWARLKATGLDLAYWRQSNEGRWARQT